VKVCCGWCGQRIKAEPIARYADPQGSGYKYPLHAKCALDMHKIFNSPPIEVFRIAVMHGKRMYYDWQRDKWH